MHNKHLGYVTTSPSNLGTGMKIIVQMKIPKLSQDGRLVAVLKKLNLNFKYCLYNKQNKLIKQEEADNNTIVEISSLITLGKSEVILKTEVIWRDDETIIYFYF
jgi:protein-arginine kinase